MKTAPPSRLLRCLAVASMSAFLATLSNASEPAPKLRVALYDDAGSAGPGVPKVRDLLGKQNDTEVAVLNAEQIRCGGLEQFGAVIFTGGSGSKQAETLQVTGREQVKRFVENGGGYLGICAGAYLACDGFSWGAKVLDAKTVSQKWRRGRGIVSIEYTDLGRKIFGERFGQIPILYANGPIIKPAANDQLPDFSPLALFRSELAENESPAGVMIDSPAIVAGSLGKGRVLCFSPHPEQTEGLGELVVRAIRWISGAEPDPK
ncbi:MAG: BPL-N domain-containing protein [Verrucomicrobiota bacterium]|nr:BPL-N domain-containing protein [Verrucomicrobiota bacterium]